MTGPEVEAILDKYFHLSSQYRGGEDNVSRFDQSVIDKTLSSIEGMFEKPMEKEKRKQEKYEKELDEELKKKVKNQDAIDKLNAKISKCTEKLDNYSKAIEEAKKRQENAIRNDAKNEVYTKASNGWNNKTKSFGGQVENFGKALNTLGKGKGVLGVIGSKIGAFGGAISKLAGPIGVAINVLDTLQKTASALYKKGTLDIEQGYERKVEQLGIRNIQQEAINKKTANAQQAQQQLVSQQITYAQQAQQAQIQLAQSMVSEYGKLAIEGTKIGNEGYVKSHEMAASAPFDIKGAAYAAANAAIDLSGSAEAFKVNQSLADKKVDLAKSNYAAQMGAAAAGLKAQREATIQNMDIQNDLVEKQAQLDVHGSELEIKRNEGKRQYDAYQAKKDVASSATMGVSNAFTGLYEKATLYNEKYQRGQTVAEGEMRTFQKEREYLVGIMNANANVEMSYNSLKANITSTNANMVASATQANNSIQQSIFETQQQLKNSYIEAAKQIAKAWMNMTQKMNDEFLKMEDASTKMGRGMGYYGQQLQDFNAAMANMRTVVAPFGKDTEWLQKQQSAYQETTGRNVQFSEKDFKMSAGMSVLLGDDLTQELNSGMEIFNNSIADGDAMILQMYKNVSKMGLNGKKYAKDLANNLKLAEKYQFKNGVKSLMEMSKWAQNMRFNMNSLDGTLNDIQKGGLEGIVKKSANLQVLGGSYAMGADPMAMAYEAFMDPEGLAKRFNSMIADEGTFNSRTGNIDFGIAAQMKMQQFAEATGQDIKDVKNQARQQAKLKQMQGLLSGDLNEDQMALIANKAKYNPENGKWEVTDASGKNTMDVSTINSQNIDQLGVMDEDDPQKTMVEIQNKLLGEISTAFSVQEEYRNEEQKFRADLISQQWGDLLETNHSIIQKMSEEFKENREKYLSEMKLNLGTMVKSVNGFWDTFKEGNDKIDKAKDAIMAGANSINTTLTSCTNAALQALDKMSDGKVGAMTVDVPEKLQSVEEQASNSNGKKFMYGLSTTKGISQKEYDLLKQNDRYGKLDRVLAKGDDGTYYFTNYNQNGRNAYQYVNEDILNRAGVNDLIEGTRAKVKEDKAYEAYVASKSHTQNYSTGYGAVYSYTTTDSDVMNRAEWDDVQSGKKKVKDGFISQNGSIAKIDSEDQVLAAKNGGPIDKMLSQVTPRPMPYNTQVMERPYGGSSDANGKMEIAPIQIQINGNIQLNGSGGSSELTQQLANDPNFIRSLSQIISLEVEKKVQGGRVVDPVNRNLSY